MGNYKKRPRCVHPLCDRPARTLEGLCCTCLAARNRALRRAERALQEQARAALPKPVCGAEDGRCGAPVLCRGLCRSHYDRWRVEAGYRQPFGKSRKIPKEAKLP